MEKKKKRKERKKNKDIHPRIREDLNIYYYLIYNAT